MEIENRAFAFSDGSSDKFWTITLTGTSHTVRFGRKGTNGQEQTKELTTAALARSSYEKLIAEKLKKGYREVEAPPEEAPPASRAAELSPRPATPHKLASSWSKIDRWLKKNAPLALATLQPAATEQKIDDLAEQLGMPVPPDLAASLLIHNGQSNGSDWIGLMDGWRLMTCAEIADWSSGMGKMLEGGEFRKFEARGSAQVKSDWWNRRWVPFLEGGDGNCLVVDMDPAAGGKAGQVIEFRHDEPSRPLRADSLTAYLSQFIEDLHDEQYGVTEEGGLEF